MSTAIDNERQPHEYYSPERKAEVLAMVAANEGNVLKTARETGIRHSLIQYWQANQDRYANLRHQKQLDLASRYERLTHICLDNWESKIDNASLAQLATASAIATDKMLLLRGQPTSITEHVERPELVSILREALESQLDVIDVEPSDR